MHHYSMLPFASGEIAFISVPKGGKYHGALAEKALEPVLPGKDVFLSHSGGFEVLSSDGSTSWLQLAVQL